MMHPAENEDKIEVILDYLGASCYRASYGQPPQALMAELFKNSGDYCSSTKDLIQLYSSAACYVEELTALITDFCEERDVSRVLYKQLKARIDLDVVEKLDPATHEKMQEFIKIFQQEEAMDRAAGYAEETIFDGETPSFLEHYDDMESAIDEAEGIEIPELPHNAGEEAELIGSSFLQLASYYFETCRTQLLSGQEDSDWDEAEAQKTIFIIDSVEAWSKDMVHEMVRTCHGESTPPRPTAKKKKIIPDFPDTPIQ